MTSRESFLEEIREANALLAKYREQGDEVNAKRIQRHVNNLMEDLALADRWGYADMPFSDGDPSQEIDFDEPFPETP